MISKFPEPQFFWPDDFNQFSLLASGYQGIYLKTITLDYILYLI